MARVYWGPVGNTGVYRVQVTGSAPHRCATAQKAKTLALRLVGGRADRVTSTTFPAPSIEAKLAKLPAATTAAVAAAEHAAKIEVGAAKARIADRAKAAKAAVALAVELAELFNGSAKDVVIDLESGDWDADLDAVETAEKARDGGPRVTVTRAIDKRREAKADAAE